MEHQENNDTGKEPVNNNIEDHNKKQEIPDAGDADAAKQETKTMDFDNRIPLDDLKNAVAKLKAQLGKVIVGQQDFVELLIAGLLSNGHVLIEGVPGVAKTLTAKLFAKSLDTNFSRIQFTPDLMPSDVLGTSILNSRESEFEFKPGPIFRTSC